MQSLLIPRQVARFGSSQVSQDSDSGHSLSTTFQPALAEPSVTIVPPLLHSTKISTAGHYLLTPPSSDAEVTPMVSKRQPRSATPPLDAHQESTTSSRGGKIISGGSPTIHKSKSNITPTRPLRKLTVYKRIGRGTCFVRTAYRKTTTSFIIPDPNTTSSRQVTTITKLAHETESNAVPHSFDQLPPTSLDALLKTYLAGLYKTRHPLDTLYDVSTNLFESSDQEASKETEHPLIEVSTDDEKPIIEYIPPLFTKRPTPQNNTVRYFRGSSQQPLSDPEEGPVEVEYALPEPKDIKTLKAMAPRLLETFGHSEQWIKRLDQELKRDRSKWGKLGEDVEKWLVEGYEGKVVWNEGVGKLIKEDQESENDGEEDGDVHVFLDHSNIHHGMIDALVAHPLPHLSLGTKKMLNLPILSFLMVRGRKVAKDGMHLVGSSPLEQGLNHSIRMGWRCCILKRVAVDTDEDSDVTVEGESGKRNKKKKQKNKVHSKVASPPPRAAETHKDAGPYADLFNQFGLESQISKEPPPPAPLDLPDLTSSTITARRMREQAVDELLHLQILHSILTASRPGTLVIGTGDAKGGQFNPLGFLGCVRIAVDKGWKVELWGWKRGISWAWREEAKKLRWSRKQFRIRELDDWVGDIVHERKKD